MNAEENALNPPRAELISLIGYRGCGKTSVGRLLAERLRWLFVDTDERIESEAGRTVAEIFAADGERMFRQREAEVVEAAMSGRQRVISVGGGAVLVRRNRKALRNAGACIWLTASAEELYRRIAADEKSAERRPSLTALPGPEEVESVLQARLPVYEATADYVISTMGRSIEEIVDEIFSRLGLNTSE